MKNRGGDLRRGQTAAACAENQGNSGTEAAAAGSRRETVAGRRLPAGGVFLSTVVTDCARIDIIQ